MTCPHCGASGWFRALDLAAHVARCIYRPR